jgi:hypothetical protein
MIRMQCRPAAGLATVVLLTAGLTGGVIAGCKSSTPAPANTTAGTNTAAAPAPAAGTTSTSTPPSATDQTATGPAPGTTTGGPPGAPGYDRDTGRTLREDLSIPVRITERLSASHNDVGDRFTGVVAEDVREHGDVVLRRGTPVEGHVIASKGRGRFKGAGALGIELTSIAGTPVSTSEYEVAVKGKGRRTAKFAGGGAGVGALIGGLAGGGKGALIGGLAGAGGGTAADAFTGNKDVVIPSESVVRFRLERPVILH